MLFKRLFLSLTLGIIAFHALGQPVKLIFTAGAGPSFVTSNNLNANLKPVIRPHATAGFFILLHPSIALEAGAGYEWRGFRMDSTYIEGRYREHTIERVSRHYLTLPIQLSFKVFDDKEIALWLGAGMNYGILISATGSGKRTLYFEDEEIDHYTFHYERGIEMNPNNTTLNLYRFDTGFKTFATLVLDDKYLLRGYYGYSLYNVQPAMFGITYRQHNVGLSLGIMLP